MVKRALPLSLSHRLSVSQTYTRGCGVSLYVAKPIWMHKTPMCNVPPRIGSSAMWHVPIYTLLLCFPYRVGCSVLFPAVAGGHPCTPRVEAGDPICINTSSPSLSWCRFHHQLSPRTMHQPKPEVKDLDLRHVAGNGEFGESDHREKCR